MKLLPAALTLLVLATPLAAQDSTSTSTPATDVPWRTSYFPYFTVSPNDGLMGIGRVLFFRQANYDDRVSLRDAVALEGGYSTRKAWLLRGRVDLPRLRDGWRLAASVEGGRQPHFGVPEAPISRSRAGGWVDVTRRLKGPLQLALRGAVAHQRIEGDYSLYFRYPRTTIDADGCPPPMLCFAVTGQHVSQTDINGRAALVLDLRDREFDTRKGALIEAGLFTGSGGGDQGYFGGYAIARGWVSPRRGTRLTARIGMQRVSKTDAIGILHEIPAWESPITTFGGPNSHRGLGIGAVPGRGGDLASGEVRHDLLNVGEIGAITAVVFVDGSRAYQDKLSPLVDPTPGVRYPVSGLNLTAQNWNVGVGGGVAIRVLRSAQLTITAARGAGVTRWYVSSGWSW